MDTPEQFLYKNESYKSKCISEDPVANICVENF